MDNLIADGPWCEYGKDRNASISFTYELDKAELNLTISATNFKAGQDKQIPVLLFDSNFHNPLDSDDPKAKLKDLHLILENWSASLAEFKSLITDVLYKEV